MTEPKSKSHKGDAFEELVASYKGGGKFPHKVNAADLALMGIATHKLTRLITKDWVTARCAHLSLSTRNRPAVAK